MLIRRQRRALTVITLSVVSALTFSAQPVLAQDAGNLWERLREKGGAIAQDLRARAKLLRKNPQPSPAAQATGSTLGPTDERDGRAASPDVLAPSFSRIVIETNGAAQFQGHGSPGSEVLMSAGGKTIATVKVNARGEWTTRVAAGLVPGDYRVTTGSRRHAGAAITAGQDIRIRVPQGYSDRIVILYNGTEDASDPARRRAEELADAASRKFSEVIEEKKKENRRPQGAAQTKSEGPVAASPNVLKQFEDGVLEARDRVQDWLAKANRTYQNEIARRLSVPAKPPAETAEAVPDAMSVPARKPELPSEAERRQREDADLERRDAQANEGAADKKRAEELAAGERARREAEAAARRAAEEKAKIAAEKRRAEAEAARNSEAEVREKANRAEAARLEAERLSSEMKRLAELARKQEDALRIEEEHKQQEAKRLAEEAGKQKKKLSAEEETKKRDEAKRVAEEAGRKESERKRLAEEQDALRRAAKTEKQVKRETDVRRKEEEILAQQDEVERLAADLERRTERPMPVEPPKGIAEALEDEPAAAEPVEIAPEPPKKRKKDSRPSEGSAEEPAPGDPALAGARTAEKPRVCRIGKTRRSRRAISYVVKPGDTLWSISERYLGSGTRFDVIFRANEDRLHDPNILRDCQRIIIPLKKRRR